MCTRLTIGYTYQCITVVISHKSYRLTDSSYFLFEFVFKQIRHFLNKLTFLLKANKTWFMSAFVVSERYSSTIIVF